MRDIFYLTIYIKNTEKTWIVDKMDSYSEGVIRDFKFDKPLNET